MFILVVRKCSSFPLAVYFFGSRWSRTSNDFFINWQIIVGKFAIVLGLHSAGPIQQAAAAAAKLSRMHNIFNRDPERPDEAARLESGNRSMPM